MELKFGERVRLLREEQGVSQAKLGVATQMTQRKISYIECGKFEPSVEDIAALCRYFNVSADYFLNLPPHLPYPKR